MVNGTIVSTIAEKVHQDLGSSKNWTKLHGKSDPAYMCKWN